MKKLIIGLLAVSISFYTQAQEKTDDYKMWVGYHITLKKGKEKEAIKRIQAHDKKFHNGTGGLLYITNGENAGDFYWVYGPNTFADYDNINLPDGHDADNNQIATEFIEEFHETTYWKQDKELLFEKKGNSNSTKLELEYVKLYNGKYEEFSSLIKKHLEVFKKYNLENVYTYFSRFGSKDGYSIMLEFPFTNWGDLDKDIDYKTKFESVHGEGSLKKAGEKWNECVENAYVEAVVIISAEE